MGAVRDGLELTIMSLGVENRLTDAHAALVEAARLMASTVEGDPSSAALWREFRATVVALMEADDGAGDDEQEAFLDAVRTPVGDSADGGSPDVGAGGRGGRGAVGSASDAVAKKGRGRRPGAAG